MFDEVRQKEMEKMDETEIETRTEGQRAPGRDGQGDRLKDKVVSTGGDLEEEREE